MHIWDTRNFEKPIVSLETERAVSRISWCPTRPGLLASLARDSAAVVLHDIMSWAVGHEDGESSVQVCNKFVLNIFLFWYKLFLPHLGPHGGAAD